jgi:6,7-dimethyl-8-ribityllumazine synthase
MPEFHGTPSAEGRRIAIVASRFNEEVTQRLVDGAIDALRRHGASHDDIDVFWVPGAWELVLATRRAMTMDRYSAIVAVGAVIRGDTPHFEYIAREASSGLMQSSMEYDVPLGFGVLTCDTMEQALARAGGEHGNKGWDAALAALELADLVERLDATDAS